MARNQYIDRDNLYSDRMDADSGGEDFMGGQGAPNGGIAGLPPEIAAAISQLMSAQAAGAPAEVSPGMVAGEAAGIPELLAKSDTAGSAATGALPAEVAPAMAAGKGSGIAELLAAPAAAPVAAYQAPTAREMRDGVGKDGQVAALSQTPGYGMVPVYQSQQGRGGDRGPPVLMGYKFNPYEAGLTTVDTPKPAAILAEEKRIGKEMEPTYATYTEPRKGPGGGGGEVVAYGPPTGYRYDNGESQYVKFDSSGKYYETEKRKSGFDQIAPILAVLASAYLGPMAFEALGLTGAGAGAGAGAAGTAAFSPQMIAAGMAPGAAGATGAVSGALTGANLAAASGVGSLGAGAATLGGLTAEQIAASDLAAYAPAEAAVGTGAGTGTGIGSTLAELGGSPFAGAGAAETSIGTLTNAAPSLNQLAASGMGPGSYGALNLPALEAAVAAGSIAPEALAAAQLAATGTAGAGVASLAPTLAKSLNEGIASGTFTPGSAGADLASKGLLTGEKLAAASGVVTAGATPALVDAAAKGAQDYINSGGSQLSGTSGPNGTDIFREVSKAQGVASGLGAGQMGADLASKGLLTAQELAAAAGTAGALTKDGIGDLLTKAKDVVTDKAKDTSSGSGSGIGLGGALGLMALMSMMNKGGGAAPASTATIPELTATRTQLPYDVDKKGVNPNTPYRPGQGGVTYFSPTTYTPTPKAAGGGLMSLGQSNLGSYSDGGRLLKGPGDGVSDSIPAIIGRKQPARLANGEFVIPARIVSELGNGSTDAGAKRLYEMMARVQKARRNTKNVAANTKAAKYLPA